MSQEPQKIGNIIDSVLLSAKPVKMDSETEEQFLKRKHVWDEMIESIKDKNEV